MSPRYLVQRAMLAGYAINLIILVFGCSPYWGQPAAKQRAIERNIEGEREAKTNNAPRVPLPEAVSNPPSSDYGATSPVNK